MRKNVINFENVGETISRGDDMSMEQIVLLIINDRLYEMDVISKEERDKIVNEIKTGKYVEYC